MLFRSAMNLLRDCSEIHVIAAIPNGLAVEFGRLQLPKAHPPLVLYDRHDGLDGLLPRWSSMLASSRQADKWVVLSWSLSVRPDRTTRGGHP